MLTVRVDGAALPDDEARAMWERFSAWMEEHRGDLAGFAKQEGFASAHPGVENGSPVLLLSREAAQRPYAPVAQDGSSRSRGSAGSKGRHDPRRDPQAPNRRSKK
jgi:hypothetical protein